MNLNGKYDSSKVDNYWNNIRQKILSQILISKFHSSHAIIYGCFIHTPFHPVDIELRERRWWWGDNMLYFCVELKGKVMEENLSQSLFISFTHAIMYITYVIVWGLFHLYWNFKCTKQLTKEKCFRLIRFLYSAYLLWL